VREAELPRALDALEHAGVMIDRAAAARDVARIGLFKGRAGKIFVDVFLTGHPQYEEMQRRCASIEDATGQSLSFISAEDLCLHKLLFARSKDVADLEQLLARRPGIDLAYVRRWLLAMTPDDDPSRRWMISSAGSPHRSEPRAQAPRDRGRSNPGTSGFTRR
jgi:hypothetical protein